MNILKKIILAAGSAIISTSAFACAENPFYGNFSNGTKIISVYETSACAATYVYREWAPHQKPTMRTGTPMLKLLSVDHPSKEYDKIFFKRSNGEEYVLSVADWAEDREGVATRLNLDIKKDGKTLDHYTLRRIGE